MDELIFSNVSSGHPSLYTANSRSIFWCGFLLPEGQTIAEQDILFTATVEYNGFYLFANKTPADAVKFAENAGAYFKEMEKPYQTGGIAWFTDVDGVFSADNVLFLYLTKASGSLSPLIEYNYYFGNQFATITLGTLNVSVTLDGGNNRFLFHSSNPGFISFKTNYLGSQMVPRGPFEIPLTGIVAGSMRFLVGLDCGTDFKATDISLKFFYRDNETMELLEMSYPVFKDEKQGELVDFQLSINPFDLLNEKQLSSYLAFLGKSTPGGNVTEAGLPSLFCSDYGVPVRLVPKIGFSVSNGSENIPSEESAMLVLSERVVSDKKNTWYLTPSGYFSIVVSTKEHIRILCGLSGTESVSVTASQGDCIVFKGKQPAYVPQYPILSAGYKVGANTQQQILDDACVTAWIGFVKGEHSETPVVYHSQPQGSSLFTIQPANEENLFLNYYAANSGTLSDLPETVYFPMAVYGPGIHIPAETRAEDFESQILAPIRRMIIGKSLLKQTIDRAGQRDRNKAANRGGTSASIDSVNPQGFHIQVSEDTCTWEKMQLASNQFMKSDGALSPVYSLEFRNLNATLQSAFQTNQLFLVVSSDVNHVLGDFVNEMQLEEWPFNLDVPKPDAAQSNLGQYNNILIFKYCSQTLLERVQNIQFWTKPEAFNDVSMNGLPNLSNWISDYIQKGIDKYEKQGDTDYYKFRKIATDPDWKGVIALKVDISLTTFPPELQGLLAGINLNEFSAHHFGIDLSVVKREEGGLTMIPKSSMFALIDYEDTVYRQYNSDITEYKEKVPINTLVDYAFNVLLLKVVIMNSRIVNFNSYIAFTINKLFGEKVKTDSRDNLLILDGTYENHNGVPSYTFSTTGDSLLMLDSVVIQDLEILKASFVTAVSTGESGSRKVESVFSFFGYMNFYPLQGFDLLSFGNESGDSPNGKGIAFSNMNIGLNFQIDTPTDQTYIFDVGKMSFDIGASYARQGSFYRHFPLQLSGITSGTKDNNPATQGYLNVELPSLKQQQAINGDWYGLIFKLNMGTLGALASDVGFNVLFMTPWNVRGKGAVAGLKLPGANPQAPVLSIQGVLKLNISSIRIDIADDGVSYLMKMNNISLKVLSLTFPSKGQFGFFLFGNPSETMFPESLAWYAGYLKKKK